MARGCPNGDCVIGKTEQFLAVLRDRKADRAAKAEALKCVVHFVGDMHQPLHDEDDGDKGGNARHVIFDGRCDNLHWIWDTGLLEHINRNPEALATELVESHITAEDRAEWVKGNIEDWVLEGHRLAQTVAYGDLGSENPSSITLAYERQADPGDRTPVGEGRGQAGLSLERGFEVSAAPRHSPGVIRTAQLFAGTHRTREKPITVVR